MNGGYAMVNCAGLDLGNPGTISGLYRKVELAIASGKPVVLHGLVNGAQKFSPILAYGGVESSDSVFLSFFPITLHISNEDVVTI